MSASRDPTEKPQQDDAGEFKGVVGLAERRCSTTGHVDDRADQLTPSQDGRHGEQPTGSGRLPRREEQAGGEGEIPGTELAGEMDGRSGVMKDQRRHGQDQHGESDDREAVAQPCNHPGRSRRRFWLRSGMEDGRTQIGDRLGRAHAQHAMELPGMEREFPTPAAPGEVVVQCSLSETGILPIHSGGDRVAALIAVHGVVVVAHPAMVPGGGLVRAEDWSETHPMDAVTAAALRASGGDREATAVFVRETQGAVWRLCAHLVEAASADDLTQEVYLRALPALAQFRAESSARTWVLAIARHTCMDELRRRGRGRALMQRIVARTADRAMVVPDPSGELALTSLLAGLGPERREAFVLTQVLGLSYVETASICGCELGTVRSRVARARADLVTALADDGDVGRGSGASS